MTCPYIKPHASSIEMVRHLQAKGLIIPRPNVAAKKIKQIGYERLRIYFLSRRDQPNKTFRPGTSYRDILQIYECDAKLRNICFAGVGQFELAFRNSMSEALSSRGGSHPYQDMSLFKSARDQAKAYRLLMDVAFKSKDRRAKHYYNKYTEPALPPIWVIKEFLTFGASARDTSHFSKAACNRVSRPLLALAIYLHSKAGFGVLWFYGI